MAQVSLDREERDMYFLTIVAHDVTSQPLNASIPVVVAVLDMNDNAPEFASANFSFVVREDTFPNAALIANFDVSLIRLSHASILWFLCMKSCSTRA